MAKYEATFSCGHTETVTLFGPKDERQKRIEWLAQNGTCTQCWKAAKPKARLSLAGKRPTEDTTTSIIIARDSYELKDYLKSLGFRFNGETRAWALEVGTAKRNSDELKSLRRRILEIVQDLLARGAVIDDTGLAKVIEVATQESEEENEIQ